MTTHASKFLHVDEMTRNHEITSTLDEQSLEELGKEWQKLNDFLDAKVLEEVQVVFVTCNAAIHPALDLHFKADMIVIEEGAQAGPADIASAIGTSYVSFMLAGHSLHS